MVRHPALAATATTAGATSVRHSLNWPCDRLDAQRDAVMNCLNGGRWMLVEELRFMSPSQEQRAERTACSRAAPACCLRGYKGTCAPASRAGEPSLLGGVIAAKRRGSLSGPAAGTTTNQRATPDVRAPLLVVVDVQAARISRRGKPSMAINEYRRYAAECVLIADGMTSPGRKVSLLAMAQAWLKLARRAEDDVPPTEASAPVSQPG
jgi:hypothetical protein